MNRADAMNRGRLARPRVVSELTGALAGVLATLMLAGCVSMAQQYQRPVAPVASAWRDAEAVVSPQPADARAVAETDWREVFQDARLQQVIGLSLQQNRDLRVAWLTLSADRQRLALAQQTLASQQETLKLTEYQHAQGIASGLDLAQVQTSVESARVDVATYQAQVAQDRNALELVVGMAVPDAMLPGASIDTPVALAPVPAGLDATVLLQRPDVLSAEHALKAANADIGAARAAFFPTVTLTAAAGQASTQLAGLFSGVNYAWSFAPGISVPIFNAGSLRASLDAAKIGSEIAVAQYEKAIQTAFREVADALAVRATVQQRLAAQQALVEASSRSDKLADARYRSGADSYLNALDAQRSLYSAQQNLITLQLTERSNRVALFKVLGGGADASVASGS